MALLAEALKDNVDEVRPQCGAMELGVTDSSVPTLLHNASECQVAVPKGSVDYVADGKAFQDVAEEFDGHAPYDTGSMCSSFLENALPRMPSSTK